MFPGSRAFTGNTHYGPDWARTWRRERRVAHQEVFSIYLSRVLPFGTIPTTTVERVFAALTDGPRLQVILDALPDEALEPVLERLGDFEDQYPVDSLAAVVAIQNLLPRMRTGLRGFLDVGSEMRVHRVVLRLLRRIGDQEHRDEVVRAAYPRVTTLSGRLWLLLLVGHQENVGNGLITEATEGELAGRLREEIRSTPSASLLAERDLLRLLDFSRRGGAAGNGGVVREVLADDEVLAAVLRGALTETRSQTLGEVTVQTEQVLPWEFLESLVAPDDLAQRVLRLVELAPRFANDDRAEEAIQVARRYALGWRPEPFLGGQRAAVQQAVGDDGSGLPDGAEQPSDAGLERRSEGTDATDEPRRDGLSDDMRRSDDGAGA